eukprot:g10839.t1
MGSVYATLPKNSQGRIDRRSLRFLAYRYFNEKHSLAIRGFEPSRPSNESAWAAAEILSQQVPSYVESVLMSRHLDTRGFDLHDAALLITTIEQLLYDTESNLLEKEGIRLLLGNTRLRQRTFPHWDQLVHFAHGEVQALDYKRRHGPTGAVLRVQEQLIAMDPYRTGRVPLSKFYGTGLEADWRFAESEAYLRELGALDESSRIKQVLIPNYIQAASNCIVTWQRMHEYTWLH